MKVKVSEVYELELVPESDADEAVLKNLDNKHMFLIYNYNLDSSEDYARVYVSDVNDKES